MRAKQQDSPSASRRRASGLDEWILPTEYREQHPTKFHSDASLYWFIRQNRPALLQASALSLISGRLHVHPERLTGVVIEAGKRALTDRNPQLCAADNSEADHA